MTRPQRLVVFGLIVIAATFTMATVLALVTDGVRLTLGPVRVAITNPGRIALQAAIAWLIAMLASPYRRSRFVMVPMLLVLLVAWADSAPRRVGDGAEYMAMALNMSHGRLPALSPQDLLDRSRDLESMPGFEGPELARPLIGPDGRQDFHHFWLYPLLATPFIAAARMLGSHPNHAFTLLNLSLLCSLLWLLVGRGHTLAAGLIVAGPAMWWVDKAHPEIFLFVTLAGAALCFERHTVIALVLAALATAQNPAAGCMLAGIAAYAIYRSRSMHTAAAIAGAIAIAAVPAVYYERRLGVLSPLSDGVSGALPGLRATLTALIDPNLGLILYAPVLVAVAAAGLFARRSATVLVLGVAIVLLVLCGATFNVNHGGTPGMSRYALWLLAVLTPLVALGSERLERREWLALAALGISAIVSVAEFQPSRPERANTPSRLATLLWSRFPAADDPLPEVFAERVSAIDGLPPVPVAMPGCRKILIRGDGRDAWWPFPCEPRAAPAGCVSAHAFCYVDDGRFSVAPAQPRFVFDPAPDRSWSLGDRGRLPELLRRLGGDARSTTLPANPRRVLGGDGLLPLFIVEGRTGTAIWVMRAPSWPSALIRLRTERPSQIELWGMPSYELLARWRVRSGTQTVPLQGGEQTLVLVTNAD